MRKASYSGTPKDATHVYLWSHGRRDVLKNKEGKWFWYAERNTWIPVNALLCQFFDRAFYG